LPSEILAEEVENIHGMYLLGCSFLAWGVWACESCTSRLEQPLCISFADRVNRFDRSGLEGRNHRNPGIRLPERADLDSNGLYGCQVKAAVQLA
jgi:hypothetical protein